VSLDVYLEVVKPTKVYSANITHNLNKMAQAAGIYEALWHPEEIGITKAHQLIVPLTEGLARLRADSAKYRAFNPPNGWGSYEGLVEFVEAYLNACGMEPDADVRVCR
jgi:hypothetical protein